MALFDKLFGGDGMAWRREQKDILDWAKNLYYPESGGSLIPETDNKATWEGWRDKFLSWKDAELAKPETSRWWYTFPRQGQEVPSAPSVTAPSFTPQADPYAGMGPAIYPMTTPSYTPPSAQDFSAYTSMSPFGGEGGLLYQPWSAEYLNRYVPQSLLNYTPPELSLARPTYMPNPLGLMELIEIAEEEVASEGESKDKDGKKKTEDRRGGGRGGPFSPDDYGDLSPAQKAAINSQVEQMNLSDDDLGNIMGGAGEDNSSDFGDPGVASGQHVG